MDSSDLLSLAHGWAAEHPGRRVHRLSVSQADGPERVVWIKCVTANKVTVWHRCQRLVSTLVRLPILRTTVTTGGAAAFRAQIARLRQVRAAGLHVPEVLADDDYMMVLSDLGPTMRSLLADYRKAPAPESHHPQIRRMFREATTALCELHAAGFVHGRPHVKDFTWSDGRVGLLDFEEDPTRVMSWHEARARDVWLFLNAAAGHLTPQQHRDELLAEMLESFLIQLDTGSRAALVRFVRAFRPARQAVEALVVRPLALVGASPSRDVLQSVYASRVMESICLRSQQIAAT